MMYMVRNRLRHRYTTSEMVPVTDVSQVGAPVARRKGGTSCASGVCALAVEAIPAEQIQCALLGDGSWEWGTLSTENERAADETDCGCFQRPVYRAVTYFTAAN